MGKLGIMIAKAVPPPGKLGKAPSTEDGSDAEESAPGDEDEDHAAELSSAQEFLDAVKNGSADDVLSAFKQMNDVCKG